MVTNEVTVVVGVMVETVLTTTVDVVTDVVVGVTSTVLVGLHFRLPFDQRVQGSHYSGKVYGTDGLQAQLVDELSAFCGAGAGAWVPTSPLYDR